MPAFWSQYLLLAGHTNCHPTGNPRWDTCAQCIRQFRAPGAFAQILFVNAFGVFQILDQILLRACGQHRHTIFLALAAANAYFHPVEIEILQWLWSTRGLAVFHEPPTLQLSDHSSNRLKARGSRKKFSRKSA